MPMPMPRDNEEHDQFMERCHSQMSDEMTDDEQRNAVCQAQWDKEHEGKMAGYPLIVNAIISTPWAILPAMLATIVDLISFRSAGGILSEEDIRQRIGAAAKPDIRRQGTIAVLPVFGVIAHRAGMMTDMSGGTSIEKLSAAFRQALGDTNVSAIVLDIDSPGGTVNGVSELADEIYRARERKPVYAIANSMAASAAYWLGTGAAELSITPSGDVGSIGVLAAHDDISKALEMRGVKTSIISAGRYKAEASPYGALEDEARAAIQERVNDYYDAFVANVARARGVKAAEVRSGYGEGRMVGAKRAKELGMVDHVETLDQLLARLMRPGQQRQPSRAGSIALDLQRRRLGLAARKQALDTLVWPC